MELVTLPSEAPTRTMVQVTLSTVLEVHQELVELVMEHLETLDYPMVIPRELEVALLDHTEQPMAATLEESSTVLG